MTIPTREEHLIRTLRWLESRVSHTCPVCIRLENELRDELALVRSRMADKAIGEATHALKAMRGTFGSLAD
jgi:hypothetical protein